MILSVQPIKIQATMSDQGERIRKVEKSVTHQNNELLHGELLFK
jgi:hypothetical protein